MGRQQLLVLAIAIISALLGTAFLSGQLGGSKQIHGVAIAQTDIEPHTFIVQNQVTGGIADGKTFQPGILFRPDQVIGRIPRAKISKGQPITAAMLYSGTAGLEHVIPVGFRAMSLPVRQAERELKLFNPGGHIDIIATVRGGKGFSRTGTILENILLLAKEVEAGKRGSEISFIVAVDPKGAEKLSLALKEGELRVVLRKNEDDSIIDSPGISVNDLIKGMAVDGAGKLFDDAFEPESMEVIRGTRRTTDYFKEGALSKASAKLVQSE